MLPRTTDVVIIGGGVMGASTAYHLAQRGCRNVVLLERQPFFSMGATGKNAGGIRHQFASEINVRLSLKSIAMLEHFEEEIGQAVDLRFCGYLMLLTHEEDVATFRQNVALQHRLGVMTEWLTAHEVAQRVPLMRTDDVLAGTFYARDGLADPTSVTQGYINAARRLGVQPFTDVEVTGIAVEAGRVHGVQTPQDDIATPVVVNAAGPWAAIVGRMAGVDIPVQPVRRQLLVTTPIPELPRDFPFVVDFAQSLYFHREGEGLLTGMSNPDERPGFDESVDLDWELVHLEAAIQRLPLLERAGRAAAWAGLYEVSPDAHPILGRVAQVEGFYCINGFSGHGFMHGPIAGLLLAEEILDGAAHTLDITPLRLERFGTGEAVPEYNVI